MKISGILGIILILFLTACSTFRSMSSAQEESDLVENGYKAMSGGDYATAEYLLNQALAINRKNPYTLLNLGVVYQETHRYDKARQFYQSVIDLHPGQTAAATNVQGYAGKNLADIARINMKNLPPPALTSSRTGQPDDTDADGVPDDQDQCNNTPPKAAVSANGCWTLIDIFPSGQSDVKADAFKDLDDVAQILMQNPSLRIEIQGHTDDRGSASSNQLLSEKRAQAVMHYLIEKGVAPERLRWVGYGQTRPLVSNKTAEGRKQNRRVELSPLP
jgi:outer membrane protein OmpA-like peptidoglycan-associated protein